MNKNLKAFLDVIAHTEGTRGKGDDGYDVLVGGKFFDGYEDHPRIKVNLPNLGIKSTAAGRYQILERYYDAYKKQLNLRDFGKSAQDAIAIQLIKECKAIDDIENGDFVKAVKKCASRWASFPSAGYGQREHSLKDMQRIYMACGGNVKSIFV